MRMVAWVLALLVGFGLMLFSYYAYHRVTEPTPWTEGIMYVGRGRPRPGAEAIPFTPARIRFLPPSGAMAEILKAATKEDAHLARRLEGVFGEAVVLYPGFRRDFTADRLASGRLPAAGASEVVAGYALRGTREIVVAGRTLQVVGVLRREVALFSRACLVPEDSADSDLFDLADKAVENAYVLTDSFGRLRDGDEAKRLGAAFPTAQFTPITGVVRVDAGPYYLYLAGLTLLLTGGSGLFVRFYVFLAGRVRNRWLAGPFCAICEWKRLFVALHVIFFGGLVVCSAMVYLVPEVQMMMLSVLQGAFRGPSGPLAVAAKAYASGNILWAALVTLAVNFLLGSLVSITIPSLIVPGIGVLIMGLRSVVIGLALAPSMTALSNVMLAHSFTVLVEFEAYILAAFFALMVPIYLFRRQEGPTVSRRYGRALLLNVKGSVFVLILLAVAAVYEAMEVILQWK